MAGTDNRKQTVHTFSKGMNKDLDYTLRSPDMYYDADNLRLTTSAGSDNKVLKNIKGILDQGLSLDSGQYIIGTCSIRNYLILFTTDETGDVNQIWRCTLDSEGSLATQYKLYDGDLGWDITDKIKAVGRYENAALIKVYWTDNKTTTKFANIMDDITGSISMLEFTPDAELPELTLDSIISGSLYAGVVQYTYQFYTDKETESLFAPLTQPIPITSAPYSYADDRFFYGDLPETFAGVGFKLKLVNPNTGFNRVRLVAVFYESLNGTPTIRIADEKQISTTAGDIYLQDTGETLGEYTLEEISIAANNIFICKDLEVKDNMLFAANITEEYFDVDFDARAYRFLGSSSTSTDHNYQATAGDRQKARVYDLDDTEYEIDGFGGTPYWGTIPVDSDCINKFNNLDNDDDRTKRYMYQMDGVTIGGSGEFVSYTFNTEPIVLDSYATSEPSALAGINGVSYSNYASPIISSEQRGWARDEVYRCALVLIDNKGRSSFAKWIGDIRTPAQHDGPVEQFNIITKDDQTITGNVLYPVFTVDISGVPEAVAYKIVYVKREATDRSILAQGLFVSTDEDTDIYYPSSCFGATNSNQVYRILSPEIVYNKNLQWQGDDYIEVVNRIAGADAYSDQVAATPQYFWKATDTDQVKDAAGGTDGYNIRGTNHITSLEDAIIVGISDSNIGIGGLVYNGFNELGDEHFYGGSSLLIKTPVVTGFDPVDDNTYKYIVNYRRNVWDSQYGGLSYEDRTNNQYIAASSIQTVSGLAFGCYYGDTFIGYFDDLHLIADLTQSIFDANPTNPRTRIEHVSIPVETSINLPYRRSRDWFRSKWKNGFNAMMMQEVAGTYQDGETIANEYIQEWDLYSYNSVYSQQNIINTYFSEPLNFTSIQTYDTRIKNSQVKTNNESVDSWTKFPTNDYIEVDTKYGPVNNIVKFNDKLLYFQDTGFGVVSVNQRSLISDENPGGLVLGTGGVLDRYDYISESVGNTNRFGIANSTFGLYWLDNNKQEIYKFSNQLEPLGYTKGIKSYLNKYDGIVEVVTGWDKENNEVLFTIEGYVTGLVTDQTIDGVAVSDVQFNDLSIFRDADTGFFSKFDAQLNINN